MSERMPWFKCYPEKLLGAMSMMRPDEQLLYVIVLLRIYETNGKCRDGFDDLALRSRLPIPRTENALESLLEKKKLGLRDGFWTNTVADEVLAAREERSKIAKESAQTRWEKQKQNQQSSDADALPLESKGNAIKTQSKKERKKESTSSPKAKTINGFDYSEEFETKVWQPYPRKKGTSKHKAYQLWRMLNEQNQARVIAAIPLYAAEVRGKDESYIKHLQYWIKDRMYETAVAPPSESNVVAIPWFKTATRDQWARALKVYENDSNWRNAWGPAPGFEGCMVPQDLIDALPYHLHPKSDPRLRSQNVAGKLKGSDAV